MSSAAPANNVTESATCAPTRILRRRCWRTLPLVPRPPSFNPSTRSALRTLKRRINSYQEPVKIDNPIANKHWNRQTGRGSGFQRKKFGRQPRDDGTKCQAANAPPAPAITLTSKLSKTKSASTLVREAPMAMRNAISRRRPLKRTSNRLATLLHAISKTKLTAAKSVRSRRGNSANIFRQNPQRRDEFAIDVIRILGPITLFQRWQCRTRLLHGRPGFNRPTTRRKREPRISPFMTEAGKLKRFRCPNFRNRVRAKPSCGHIRQNANDCVRRSVESDVSPNHIRIASEAFLPEIFRHQGDIGAFLFFRQKIAAEDRTARTSK